MRTREELITYLQEHNAFANESKANLSSGIIRYVNNRPELLEELKQVTQVDSNNVTELIYNLINPECTKTCEVCGNPTAFSKYYVGYKRACCNRCAHLLTTQKGINTKVELYGSASYNNKDKAKQTCLNKYGKTSYTNREKAKQTCLNKYGVENVAQVKSTTNKAKQTCLNKYGVDNIMKTEEGKLKQKSTNLRRRGVEYAMQSELTKKHYIENCLAKTGYEWYTQTSQTKEKKEKLRLERVKNFEIQNNCISTATLKNEYGQAWHALGLPTIKYKRCTYVSDEYLPLIQKSFEDAKLNASCAESDILEYCRSLLPDTEIIQHCRNLIRSSKGACSELDIYLPSKKVAIEYNGIYWHAFKDKNYHLHKTEECEKLGIRLIHVWEDLWLSKKEIYKSIIASALGVYERRIYARNCECRSLTNIDYEEFLNINHIQGSVKSSIRLGLYYKGELVQVAGWGKSRFKSGEVELYRMCTELNTQVIGGFSKLIKHSELKEFVSYVDRSLFSGQGYLSSGFTLRGTTQVGYFYHDSNPRSTRISRYQAQKHKLKSWLPKFDEALTEEENMQSNGYSKLYDCGNYLVTYSTQRRGDPIKISSKSFTKDYNIIT